MEWLLRNQRINNLFMTLSGWSAVVSVFGIQSAAGANSRLRRNNIINLPEGSASVPVRCKASPCAIAIRAAASSF
ncbi:hypothetical protein D3C80_2054840 [compost metagenome]